MGTVYSRVILTKPFTTYCVEMPSPISISATEGVGALAGDIEITWRDLDSFFSSYSWFPYSWDVRRDACIWVYISRDNIFRYSDWKLIPVYNLLNVYSLESFSENYTNTEKRWVMRGRDMIYLLNSRNVTLSFDKNTKLEAVGKFAEDYPTAPHIISYVLNKYARPEELGGFMIHTGLLPKTDPNTGEAFPVISYECQDASICDVILELSRSEYTGHGYYSFKIGMATPNVNYIEPYIPLAIYWYPQSEGQNKVDYYFSPLHINYSEEIYTTNTMIAQRFTTPPSLRGSRVASIALFPAGFGSLVGNIRIETDAGGSPSGVLAGANAYKNNVNLSSSTIVNLEDATKLSPNTSYWLVFVRTSGKGRFCGSAVREGNRCKYYDGSWKNSWLHDMHFIVWGSLEHVVIREGLKSGNTEGIIRIQTGQTYVGSFNCCIVDCGKDPNGVSIFASFMYPTVAYSRGLKIKKEYKSEFAETWLKTWEEPKTWDGEYHTFDGVAVLNHTQYVALCRSKVKARGEEYARQTLSEVGRLLWTMSAECRGTNEFTTSQVIWFESKNFGFIGGNRKSFIVQSVKHDLDVNGWRTTIDCRELLESEDWAI